MQLRSRLWNHDGHEDDDNNDEEEEEQDEEGLGMW